MSEALVTPVKGQLRGSLRVPADKSISHRAVLFAALAEGVSHLTGVLDSADVRSTIEAVRALGAQVSEPERGTDGLCLSVTGWGATGPLAPGAPVDCGNSGTTVRLLAGVLAGWPVDVTMVGDESLSGRPMRRIADPLSAMGAGVETGDHGGLPMRVRGGSLHALEYRSPVASAQVKSAVLLAGIRAEGVTTVIEPAVSRDHTERLLPAFGVPVTVRPDACSASVTGPAVLRATDVRVPADPSSAAFAAVAACMVPGAEVVLRDVGANPTRTGFVRVLERMGASIVMRPGDPVGGEPVADLTVRYVPQMVETTVAAEEVPSLVDEVPILAVAATRCHGTTRFEGVAELRVKESDRLEAISAALRAYGATVRVGGDWLEVDGPVALRGAEVDSLGDHRLAMAWTVAALTASTPTRIRDYGAVAISYPGFADDICALGGDVRVLVS